MNPRARIFLEVVVTFGFTLPVCAVGVLVGFLAESFMRGVEVGRSFFSDFTGKQP